MPSIRPLISPHSQTISAAAIYHSRKQTSPVPRRCEKFSHPQLSKHVFIISVKTYSVHKALNYGDSFCNNTFLMTGNNFTQMQPLAGRRQLRSHPSRRVETLGLLLCTLPRSPEAPTKYDVLICYRFEFDDRRSRLSLHLWCFRARLHRRKRR